MIPATDEVWEMIAKGCIERAEAVDCSLEAFAEGMKIIYHAIAERRMLAQEEVENARG